MTESQTQSTSVGDGLFGVGHLYLPTLRDNSERLDFYYRHSRLSYYRDCEQLPRLVVGGFLFQLITCSLAWFVSVIDQ